MVHAILDSDGGDYTLTEWEHHFLTSLLGFPWLSGKQEAVLDRRQPPLRVQGWRLWVSMPAARSDEMAWQHDHALADHHPLAHQRFHWWSAV